MGRIRMKQVEGFGKVSLAKAIDEFLRSCRLRNLSPKTIRYYEEDLEYFSRNICVKHVSEICRETVDNFIIHEMDKGNRITAINTRLRGIRVFINFCSEREYAEGFSYPLLKEDETVKEPYTDEELRKLLRRPSSDSWAEWRVWAVINTFLATGIRASTLLSIRISDIDFKQNTILLTKLKNRKQQMIPLSEALKNVLNDYLKLWDWNSEDYLFPTITNTQMNVHSLESAVKKYNVARGVTKTSLHLFRHTFAETDFPTYDIAMRNIDIKKKKQKYNGLTYEKMFDHIRKVHGEEALNDFLFQMDLNHNEAGAYGRVKSWFLAEHADYKA